jgi:hypothetical protein
MINMATSELDLERDPAWIFQQNTGPLKRQIEVSVCLYEGRAYRRYSPIGWGTVPWYSTASRLDSTESEWQACHRNGSALIGCIHCD